MKHFLSSYTKHQLCERLTLVGDTTYASSWRKDKLIKQLSSYGVSEVIATFSSAEVDDALRRLNEKTSGTATQRLERLTAALTPIVISDKDIANVRELLANKDIAFVQQGLSLMEDLAPNLSAVQQILPISEKASSFRELYDSFEPVEHSVAIANWLIDKFIQWGVRWASNRERFYCIRMSGYSFEYVMNSISKEAYEFWDNTAELDLAAYMRDNLSEEESSTIPSYANFKKGPWYECDGTAHEDGVFFDDLPSITIEEVSNKEGWKNGKHFKAFPLKTVFSGSISDLKDINPKAYSTPSYQYKEQPCPRGKHYVYLRGYEKGDVFIARFSTKGELNLAGLFFDVQVDPFVGLSLARWNGVSYKSTPKSKAVTIEGDIEGTWTYQWDAFVTTSRTWMQQEQ